MVVVDGGGGAAVVVVGRASLLGRSKLGRRRHNHLDLMRVLALCVYITININNYFHITLSKLYKYS